MKFRLLRSGAALLLALSAVESPVLSQCVPDLLDGGPCCTDAQPQIPVPRRFRQDALQICWRDCDVEALQNCTFDWRIGSYNTSPCAIRRVSVRMSDSAGVVKWRGRLSVQYSRTWEEDDPTGISMQVWRFLVNGDLRPTAAAGPAPCPVPPCAPAHNNRVRFTGYLDMARSCAVPGTPRDFAWMLTHSCDLIDHSAGFPRAGSFHPNRAYTFVGPAAGFAVGPIQPLAAGGSVQEAVRRVRFPGGPPICQFEEQIDNVLDTVGEFCICGPAAAPPQYDVADLGLAGACGTSISTPGGPFLPGYLSMGIGSWVDPTTFPGVEALRWNVGGYDYFDPCTGVTRQEVCFGVTTIGGFQARTIPSSGVPGTLLFPEFVDQHNAIRAGVTVMNVPWKRSDHFLNLNHP